MSESVEKRLKKEIKKSEKIYAIVWCCSYIFVFILWLVLIINLGTDFKFQKTEDNVLDVIISIFAFACSIYIFVKKLLPCYKDSKLNDDDRYQMIRVVVIRARTRWSRMGEKTEIIAKNIETGEEVSLVGSWMKENETYWLLQAKNSKVFEFELAEQNKQEN